MNIFEKIAKGEISERRKDSPEIARQVERLKRMHMELSTKSSMNEGSDFKVITGAALTPQQTKTKAVTIEQQLVEGFKGNTTAFAVIRKVSEVASQIKWTAQISKDGVDWTDEDGELQAIIDRPNSNMTSNEFRINAMTYLMSTGNVFFKEAGQKAGSSIVRFSSDEDGNRVEFELLPTNLVTIRTNSDNSIRQYDYQPNGQTLVEPLTPEQITHVKFLDPSMIGHTTHYGISPLVAVWNIIKASNNLALADASMLENKGAIGVISNKNGVTVMTEPERQEMQEATDGIMSGAENFGKTVVSGTPIEYTPIAMSSADLQMIQGGVYKDRVICTAFGVSSIMFNDQEASTLDNMKIAERKLYTDSAIPNNDVLLRAFEQGLIPNFEKKTGLKYRIIQDTSDINALQANGNEKAEKDSKNIDSIIKVNDSNLPEELKVTILVEMLGLNEQEVKAQMKEVAKIKEENQAKLDEQMNQGPEKEEENEDNEITKE